MKLAEAKNSGRVVTLSQTDNLGFFVCFHDGVIRGIEYFIPNRQEAEKAFLWNVGYPEWRKAADAAFKASRDEWLASHATLASVGAKEYRRQR